MTGERGLPHGVVEAQSVEGVVASTVPVGTSATSKPLVGHFHTPHESAPCTPNRIPIPPCDPPPDRSALASPPDPLPQDTSIMPDQFCPTARPRGGPRSRRSTVMVTTTATWLRPGPCGKRRSTTIWNLKPTCPAWTLSEARKATTDPASSTRRPTRRMYWCI